MVLLAFCLYPREVGGTWWRAGCLKEICDALHVYRQETGSFPQELDGILRYDEKEEWFFLGSKRLKHFYHPRDELDRIRYELINGEPVVWDLGEDRMEGGVGKDMDVVYPMKYQPRYRFRDFVKTKQFYLSLLFGFLLGLGVSVCLYAMWKDRLTAGRIVGAIFGSIVFILFELLIAYFILGAHVYPHH
jgi:hypothetical protein